MPRVGEGMVRASHHLTFSCAPRNTPKYCTADYIMALSMPTCTQLACTADMHAHVRSGSGLGELLQVEPSCFS